jgi:hypothetical protein
VIAATIRILRPHAEVAASDLDTFEEELVRFEPHLVICSRIRPMRYSGVVAWVELPLDFARPGRICIEGRCSKQHNLTLENMLATIDEVDRLILSK